MPRTFLLYLAVAAIAVSLRWPVLQKIEREAFGAENERVAKSLLAGRGWSDVYGDETGPTAHVVPLYPAMLAGLYAVFGTYESSEGRFAQQCASLAAAVLVILLLPAVGRKLGFPPLVGWSAAFLAAWLPAHRWHQVTGFDQSAAALMVLALIWTCETLRQEQWSNRRTVAAMGLLIGVSGLLCPNVLMAPALYFVVQIAVQACSRRRVLSGCVLISTVAGAVIAPWAIRNAVVLGGFVPLRSNFGLELAVGNRPGADGSTYAPGFYDVHPLGSPAERDRVVRLGEITYMKEKQRQAVDWIVSHKREFVRLTLRRAYLFWFAQNDKWYDLSFRLRLGSRIYGLIGICLLAAVIRQLAAHRPEGWLLPCFALGLGAPYAFTHVEVRYAVPYINIAALATCSLILAVARAARGARARSGEERPDASSVPAVAASSTLQPMFQSNR